MDKNGISNQRSKELIGKIAMQPPLCECAKIGSRPLADGNMPLLRPITSRIGYLDRHNLQAEHQHIIFSGTGDNIGLMGGEDGAELFEEKKRIEEYVIKDEYSCLDGSLVRQAIADTGIPKIYEWLGYNCQRYVDDIRKRYEALFTLGKQSSAELGNLDTKTCE